MIVNSESQDGEPTTHDLEWARQSLSNGGRLEKISGPPLQAGKWLGLDPTAVAIARKFGDESDYSKTLLVYEWMSIADIDRLLEQINTWARIENVSHGLSVAAETLMYRHGEFDRACALLKRQLALQEEVGSVVEQAKSLVRLTMALLAAGELDEAVKTRGKARKKVDSLGPGYIIYEHAGTKSGGDLYPEISMESNFAWYLEGNWQAVAEHWAEAIELEEPGGSPVHIVEAAMAAQAYGRLDMRREARFYLDELTVVLRRLEPRDWAFNGAVGRAAHAIWDLGEAAYAETYHDFARSALDAGVGDWTNTSLDLTIARMAALRGQEEEASAAFDTARRKLSRKYNDPRIAIIDHDEAIGLRLCRSHRDRASLLERAERTFVACGMRGWMHRVVVERRQHR
jgi:hypothetical protein